MVDRHVRLEGSKRASLLLMTSFPVREMNHEITHNPSFAMLRVDLQPGDRLVAEAGAMVARDTNVSMEVKLSTKPNPGFGEKLKLMFIAFIRKLVGGESFFVNHFTSPEPSRVWIAPTMSGGMMHRQLTGQNIILSSGAYVASSGDIQVKMKFGGLSTILAKEGAFMLDIGGTGELWFNSYGGIEVIELTGGEYIVDNGHLVGYEGNLQMKITTAGKGLMGAMASGEGLVAKFSGTGKIYLQTRNMDTLAGFVSGLLN